MVVCLERNANNLHMVQLMPLPPISYCSIKIQNVSIFLVLVYPDCPGKEATDWVWQYTRCESIGRVRQDSLQAKMSTNLHCQSIEGDNTTCKQVLYLRNQIAFDDSFQAFVQVCTHKCFLLLLCNYYSRQLRT